MISTKDWLAIQKLPEYERVPALDFACAAARKRARKTRIRNLIKKIKKLVSTRNAYTAHGFANAAKRTQIDIRAARRALVDLRKLPEPRHVT